MRVLTRGRVVLVVALLSASTAATTVAKAGAQPVSAGAARTSGVAVGPAVKYVREPDGTVRRVR